MNIILNNNKAKDDWFLPIKGFVSFNYRIFGIFIKSALCCKSAVF